MSRAAGNKNNRALACLPTTSSLISLNNISKNIRTPSFSLSLPIYHSLSLLHLLRLSLFTTTNILLLNLAQILSIHTSLPPAAVTLLSSFWSPFCLISPFFYHFFPPIPASILICSWLASCWETRFRNPLIWLEAQHAQASCFYSNCTE